MTECNKDCPQLSESIIVLPGSHACTLWWMASGIPAWFMPISEGLKRISGIINRSLFMVRICSELSERLAGKFPSSARGMMYPLCRFVKSGSTYSWMMLFLLAGALQCGTVHVISIEHSLLQPVLSNSPANPQIAIHIIWYIAACLLHFVYKIGFLHHVVISMAVWAFLAEYSIQWTCNYVGKAYLKDTSSFSWFVRSFPPILIL